MYLADGRVSNFPKNQKFTMSGKPFPPQLNKLNSSIPKVQSPPLTGVKSMELNLIVESQKGELILVNDANLPLTRG